MKKHIFFLIANIIGGLTLTAQEGEVINHIFDGNQQAELKEFNEAEMAYRRALSKAPEKPEALYNLGNTHFEEQDFDEAKQRYFQTQKFTENKFRRRINKQVSRLLLETRFQREHISMNFNCPMRE